MDRRSGLQNAHFSSVPTRMSLFICKKYVFLIEKNFPNFSTCNAIHRERNMSYPKTQCLASIGARHPTKNRENSTQRFPMGRVVGGNSVLQRICRNSHRFNIEIQILVGLVMVESSIELKKLSETLFTKAFQVAEPVRYEICERFAQIFLRRTHVI